MLNITFIVVEMHLSLLWHGLITGNSGYPDFTNPEMRAWWASMFSYDQYEVRLFCCVNLKSKIPDLKKKGSETVES